jgi:hypothetical protein
MLMSSSTSQTAVDPAVFHESDASLGDPSSSLAFSDRADDRFTDDMARPQAAASNETSLNRSRNFLFSLADAITGKSTSNNNTRRSQQRMAFDPSDPYGVSTGYSADFSKPLMPSSSNRRPTTLSAEGSPYRGGRRPQKVLSEKALRGGGLLEAVSLEDNGDTVGMLEAINDGGQQQVKAEGSDDKGDSKKPALMKALSDRPVTSG